MFKRLKQRIRYIIAGSILIGYAMTTKGEEIISVATTTSKIVPEGITKLELDITFLEEVQDVSIKFNLEELVKDQINGQSIMNYILNEEELCIRILKLQGTEEIGINKQYYVVKVLMENSESTQSYPVICIERDKFNIKKEMNVEAGSRYKIEVYVGSNLNPNIPYQENNRESELNYRNTILGNRKQILVVIQGQREIKEVQVIEGVGEKIISKRVGVECLVPIVAEYIDMIQIY